MLEFMRFRPCRSEPPRSPRRHAVLQHGIEIPTLPVGTSRISFSRDGFHALRYDDVELKVCQTFTLDARLALGTVSTQVDSQGDGAAARTQLGRARRRGRLG